MKRVYPTSLPNEVWAALDELLIASAKATGLYLSHALQPWALAMEFRRDFTARCRARIWALGNQRLGGVGARWHVGEKPADGTWRPIGVGIIAAVLRCDRTTILRMDAKGTAS